MAGSSPLEPAIAVISATYLPIMIHIGANLFSVLAGLVRRGCQSYRSQAELQQMTEYARKRLSWILLHWMLSLLYGVEVPPGESWLRSPDR